MNISAFTGLEGLKLSVALTKQKRDGTPESYIGFLERIGEDYIVLDYAKASNTGQERIDKVIFAIELIQGIWIYKE